MCFVNDTSLERDVAELKTRIADLEERVRIDAVAEAFIVGKHDVREGDYFLLNERTPSRLDSIEPSSGKWTYRNAHGNYVEPYEVPAPDWYQRLYTIAEVAEIVAKVTKPQPVKRRGVDFPCEECGALAGSYLVDGWYRCAKCGYPSK